MRVITLDENSRKNLLDELLKRSPNHYGAYADRVNAIIEDVKKDGDKALFSYTERFDGVHIDAGSIRVTKEEIEEAYRLVDPELLEVIRKALVNIRSYHEKQKRYSWFDSKPDGTLLGQKISALASCGVYVPGGKAVYPSSVLMNIVPAKVAGVERIQPCQSPQVRHGGHDSLFPRSFLG